MDRRTFVAGVAAVSAAARIAARETDVTRPVPLIHATDLFRPHGDPDDHFDLATVYALAARGAVEVQGILCDFPPPRRKGDPDTAAVAMLNLLTGLGAPLVVGMPGRPTGRGDAMSDAPRNDLTAVEWLLRTLAASPEPVAITIVGSSKDIAVAARREPALFAEKCRGVWLNAGSGTPEPAADDRLETNVGLDPGSYAGLFDLPCPLYWFPCYDRLVPGQGDPRTPFEHATFYQFAMRDVLPRLAPTMQRFFLSVLEQEPGPLWLRSMRAEVDPAKLEQWGQRPRNMWSTASLLHLAGLAVSTDGSLLPQTEPGAGGVYRVEPVSITCDDGGRTQWRPGPSDPPRHKFRVTDLPHYSAAMTAALASLLEPLGRGYVATPAS